MDGWRKPKRQAVERAPPVTSEAFLPPDARGPSDRSGGVPPGTFLAGALPADAPRVPETRGVSETNGDLAPMLARLREDLDATKSAFGVFEKNGRGARRDETSTSTARPAPDETDRKLLRTQDALLAAVEKVATARAERDAARADLEDAEGARRRADAAFARAAEAEARATAAAEQARETLRRREEERNADATANASTNGILPDDSTTRDKYRARLDAAAAEIAAARGEAETTKARLAETVAETCELGALVDALRETETRLLEQTRSQSAAMARLEARERELTDALAASARDARARDARTASLEKTLASARDASLAETSALRVAADAAAKAAAEAERSRVSAVAETRRVMGDLSRAKAELETREGRARAAADEAARAAAESRRLRSANAGLEKRLARAVGATRGLERAAARVRAVARGDAAGLEADELVTTLAEEEDAWAVVSEGERIEPVAAARGGSASAADAPARDGRGPVAAAAPASLAESRDGLDDEGRLVPSTDPDVPPPGDSVPASAEAAPVTAPVPRRRGKRLRHTRRM